MAIWDQQPGESAQAYEAAWLYFGLGADRSLDAVAKKLKKSNTIMGRWSGRWSWVERAEAYDRHQHDLEQQARQRAISEEAARWEQRRAEQRESGWALANGLQISAAKLLNRVDVDRLRAIDPDTLTASEAARLIDTAAKAIDTAAKIARLSAELPTEHQQIDIGPIDWDQVPEEIEAAFADGRIGLDDVLRHLRRTPRT